MQVRQRYGARPRRGRDVGFTLVEVLVVVVILGILAAVVAFGVARFRGDATAASCAADVATVARAATAYEATTGSWPASVDVLVDRRYLKSAPSGTYAFDTAAKTVTRTPACASATPSASPSGPHLGTSGTIVGIGGKCVAVADNRSAEGAIVQLATCSGATGQQWTLPSSYPGPVMALGKCLAVIGGSTDNGTRTQLSTCDGSAGQLWKLESSGDMLTNPQSSRCFDAEGASSADGTRLIIWNCHGNSNQRWVLP